MNEKYKDISGIVEALKNCEAVFFDMDGTIIDSMWMWKNIDIEYLGLHGIELPMNLQNEIEGMSFTETANYFKSRFQIPDSIETIKNTWNNMAMEKYKSEVPLKNATSEFIALLKNNGFKLGIATSNSRELAECCLESLGVLDLFDTIVTGCEVEAGKPSPDIYLQCAKNCDISPQKCLVFEDVVQGIQAGLNAGMQVCAVYDEYSKPVDHLKKEIAHYYMYDYAHILDSIKINEHNIRG